MTDTTKAASPAPLNPFAEPRKAVTGGWIGAFAAAWLGIWMAQLGPVQLLLPHQVDVVRNITQNDDYLVSVVAFGVISGIAGICALILDHVLSATAHKPGRPAFTGTLTLRYVRGTRLGPLRAEARVDRVEGVKTFAVGEISDEDGVTVAAHGVFILPKAPPPGGPSAT